MGSKIVEADTEIIDAPVFFDGWNSWNHALWTLFENNARWQINSGSGNSLNQNPGFDPDFPVFIEVTTWSNAALPSFTIFAGDVSIVRPTERVPTTYNFTLNPTVSGPIIFRFGYTGPPPADGRVSLMSVKAAAINNDGYNTAFTQNFHGQGVHWWQDYPIDVDFEVRRISARDDKTNVHIKIET